MAGLFVAMSFAGCNCDIPFEETIDGTVVVSLGTSENCEFPADEELDADGNATTTDAESGTTVKYHYEKADPRCQIVVDEWTGALADLSNVKSEMDEQVESAGLDPAKASVQLADVAFGTIELHLIQGDGAVFPIERVGPYKANANVAAGDASVNDVIVVDNPAGGDPLNPTITTTDDTEGLADAVQAAIEAEEALGATGAARVDVALGDLPDLTAEGTAPPRVQVDYEMTVSGLILIEVP
jgi:hypothetical protein